MSQSDVGPSPVADGDLPSLEAEHISDERSGAVTIYRDDMHDPDNEDKCTGWVTAQEHAVYERSEVR